MGFETMGISGGASVIGGRWRSWGVIEVGYGISGILMCRSGVDFEHRFGLRRVSPTCVWLIRGGGEEVRRFTMVRACGMVVFLDGFGMKRGHNNALISGDRPAPSSC